MADVAGVHEMGGEAPVGADGDRQQVLLRPPPGHGRLVEQLSLGQLAPHPEGHGAAAGVEPPGAPEEGLVVDGPVLAVPPGAEDDGHDLVQVGPAHLVAQIDVRGQVHAQALAEAPLLQGQAPLLDGLVAAPGDEVVLEEAEVVEGEVEGGRSGGLGGGGMEGGEEEGEGEEEARGPCAGGPGPGCRSPAGRPGPPEDDCDPEAGPGQAAVGGSARVCHAVALTLLAGESRGCAGCRK